MLTPILGGEVDDRETDNVNGSAQVRSLKSRRGDLTETVVTVTGLVTGQCLEVDRQIISQPFTCQSLSSL